MAVAAAALTLPGKADARVVTDARVASPAAAAKRPHSLLDSLRGRSRKLRARFVSPSRVASLPILRELFGDSAGRRAGVNVAMP